MGLIIAPPSPQIPALVHLPVTMDECDDDCKYCSMALKCWVVFQSVQLMLENRR